VKVEERKLARIMRRDEGLPVRVIAERLGVSKGSVSRWVRDVELTAEQHEALRQMNPRYNNQLRGQEGRSASARAARLEAQRHGRAYARRNDPLHLQGCMLYWGEGSKSRNVAALANADPEVLKLYVRFLKQCYGVPAGRMALAVNCYVGNGLGPSEIVDWWLRELDLPACCARSPVVNRPSPASRFRRGHVLPYGTARLNVYSTFVVQSIFGAIQEYAGFERPEWLDQRQRVSR
jgi:transcriptional regulator with XRE-family HTH domain